jgi:hypothetical protein
MIDTFNLVLMLRDWLLHERDVTHATNFCNHPVASHVFPHRTVDLKVVV